MRFNKLSKHIFNKIGLFLIAFSGIVIQTICFGLIGEPEPPKSLLE